MSGAPWPEPASASPAEEPDAAGRRYDPGGVLGRGGMGEVRVVHDASLARDVALKTTLGEDPGSARRLVREARLTAGLPHPNIVQVHDIGRLPDGRPYYTMQLLPGRTLADAIRAGTTLEARLELVRHVLTAAQAVAFAHGRGVVHRDLKPANILVGPLGEIVVGDWGLACPVAEASASPGGGTPGYMSPERLHGTGGGTSADVYALGAVLHEVLTGVPPGQPVARLRDVVPAVPPALAAIVERALRAAPEERYPDAGVFAADLLAWHEGRRVGAHVYTPLELAARFWNAWRVPTMVAGLGVAGVVTALALGWVGTARERDRARAAERAALESREEARESFARALVSRALVAADADQRPEAETLATAALEIAPSALGRGVLARFGGRPRLRRVASVPLPACERLVVAPDGGRVACAVDGRVDVYDPGRADGPVASVAAAVGRLAAVTDAVVWTTDGTSELWTWRPPEAPAHLLGLASRVRNLIPGAPGQVTGVTDGGLYVGHTDAADWLQGRWCPAPSADLAGIQVGDGTLIVGCDDGRVRARAPGGEVTELGRVPPEAGGVAAFGLDGADDRRVVLGTVNGWAALVSLDERAILHATRVGTAPVRDVAAHGARVAVAFTDGSVSVRDLATGMRVGGLPNTGRAAIAWSADGRHLVVASRDVAVWDVPPGAAPHAFPNGAGVSAVVPSPDGTLFAAALGDGRVRVVRIADGAEVASLRWQSQVAKDVAFDPTGRWLAAVAAGGDLQPVYDTRDWSVVLGIEGAGRRVTWLGEELLEVNYRARLARWRPGDARERVDEGTSLWEMEGDGTAAIALSRDDQAYVVRPGAPPRTLFSVPGALAAAPLGDDVLVGFPSAVVRYAPDHAERWRRAVEASVTDIAVSPARDLLAFGQLDGVVTLWRPDGDAPVAVLRGHDSRVSSVAFSPDGRWVLSGSWDGTVRLWSIADLETPASDLAATVRADWGVSVEDVLAGPI